MKKPAPALTPANWVNAALDALYAVGERGIKIDSLAQRLGVTKGSFYWHFKDLKELKAAALKGWKSAQLAILDRLRAEEHPAAEDRIRALVAFTTSKDSRHDVGVRAWALSNPSVRKAVGQVDRARLDYAEECFTFLGFAEEEAVFRARMLYFYQIGEYSIAERDAEAMRQAHAAMRAAFLIRR